MATRSDDQHRDNQHRDNLQPTGRSVLGFGGPDSDEGTPDGQSALKLHAGISVIAFALSVLVTGIFIGQDAMVPAIVFGVVALGCVGAFIWATSRLRAGRRAADQTADQTVDQAADQTADTSSE